MTPHQPTRPPSLHRQLGHAIVWGIVLTTLAAASMQSTQKRQKAKPKTESQIKAGLLYNFVRYMKWPRIGNPSQPFVIYVVGKDPLGKDLDSVFKNRTVHRHKVSIRRAGTWAKMSAAQKARLLSSHAVLIAESSKTTVKEILAHIGNRPIATFGMEAKFLHHGGDVEIYVHKKKVRFDVAKDHLSARKIKVSSKLLKHASTNPASGKRPGNGAESKRR